MFSAVAPVFVSKELETKIHNLMQKVVDGMTKEGMPYKGRFLDGTFNVLKDYSGLV
jgi:phosphoribosylamine-glycine ligase